VESPHAIDLQSREQWSVVVAKTLMKAWDQDTLDLVIAGGMKKFISLAAIHLGDQDLKHEDFKRIFRMLSHQATPFRR
jgi:hypothetical protein